MKNKKKDILLALKSQYLNWISKKVILLNIIQNKNEVFFEFQIQFKEIQIIRIDLNRYEPFYYKSNVITKIFDSNLTISNNYTNFLNIEPHHLVHYFEELFTPKSISEIQSGHKAPWKDITIKYFNVIPKNTFLVVPEKKVITRRKSYLEILLKNNPNKIVLSSKNALNANNILGLLILFLKTNPNYKITNNIQAVSTFFHNSYAFICTLKKIELILKTEMNKSIQVNRFNILKKIFPEIIKKIYIYEQLK